MFKEILSEAQLEKIKQHKYVPCSFSALDNILNKYIWEPVSKVMPYAISPNMITLSGVIVLGSGAYLLYKYDNTLTQVLPYWVYYYLVFTIFFFQTMDAVDGKHARNTKRSSPFGQLVDHGLDIFSYAFQLSMVIAGHRLGNSNATLIYQIHTWEEYYSGVFSTQVDGVGIIEFQILASFIILFIPLFGEASPYFNIFGMHFSTFFSLLMILLGVLHVYQTISRTFVKLPSDIKKESLKFFLPLIFISGSIFVTIFLDIFKTNTFEMVILNGLVFSLLTSEQIITTTTKSPQITFHSESAIYLLVSLICLFLSREYQIIIMSIFALFAGFRYISYTFSVSRQIMKYLNIGF